MPIDRALSGASFLASGLACTAATVMAVNNGLDGKSSAVLAGVMVGVLFDEAFNTEHDPLKTYSIMMGCLKGVALGWRLGSCLSRADSQEVASGRKVREA